MQLLILYIKHHIDKQKHTKKHRRINAVDFHFGSLAHGDKWVSISRAILTEVIEAVVD